MKELIVSTLLMVTLATICTGCGHNVLAYSSGKYLNVGYDPGTSKFGVQYVDGEQLTTVEKDNNKLTVEMSDTLDVNGKVTTKIAKITYEIKEQVTGADVELKKIEKK